jgi:hypothetical protein
MGIDKNKVRTQDDLNEPAPTDLIEERVDAKLKKIEGNAKRDVAQGLENSELAREGERLKKEGERELKEAKMKLT